MKFTKKMKIMTFIATAAISITAAGLALASDYGADDPLISKSYIDNVLYPQIVAYVDSKATAAPSAQSSEYQIITLYKGQTLYASSSLEFVLRPGAAMSVVSPSATNGIADVTTATELYNGYNVPINSYCIIPRGDGRGITCLSDTAYVMVRGAYEIR